LGFGNKEAPITGVESGSDTQNDPLANIPKNKWQRLWPVLACGAGLFSDGYINNGSSAPRPAASSTDS
jgi:hypothetical protein